MREGGKRAPGLNPDGQTSSPVDRISFSSRSGLFAGLFPEVPPIAKKDF